MSMTEYQWRPLDKARKEIRILDLDSGSGGAPLIGHLRHVFLDESAKPPYVTISYAWCNTALVDEISVDGKTVAIPASAGSALRGLRSSAKAHTFWLDCICIDQNNDREKGHQVGLMADMFQSSIVTLAHLGDDDGNTAKRAFEGFDAILKAWLDACEQQTSGNFMEAGTIELKNWSSLRETIDFVAIEAIMRKPYFTRLWVVQEVILSGQTILCCGKCNIRMEHFLIAATWLMNGPSNFANDFLREARSFLEMAHFAPRSSLNPIKPSLSWILYSGTWLQCSEPRDRVFGLLGLLKLRTQQSPYLVHLAADYTKSVVDVYCDATRACFGEKVSPFSLDSFGYEREKNNTIEGLPTWVPNWYCGRIQFENLGIESCPQVLPLDAALWKLENSSTSTLLVPESSVGKVLSIRGVVLETISRHSDAFIVLHYDTDLIPSDVLRYSEFISSALELLCNGSTPEDIDSVDSERLGQLEHVLGAGRPDARVIRRWLECKRSYSKDRVTAEWFGLTTHSAEPYTQTQTDEPDSSLPEAQDTAEDEFGSLLEAITYCFQRKVFKTKSGLLGIGPKALQDGDIIIVSRLSIWPMVLRRAEASGPDHYTVIDHAFVEDIHNGEEIFAAAAESEGIGTIHLV